MTPRAWRSSALRWLKFNLVGGDGYGRAVSCSCLVVRKAHVQVDYLVASALVSDGFVFARHGARAQSM